MVTGDHPITATAIGRQVNMIPQNKTANEISEEEGISLEDAIKKSTSVVIHGDLILKASAEDEGLPEGIKKNTFIYFQ